MKTMRINIILPFVATRAGGGTKIMYEYANRLRKKGHEITVLHSLKRPYKKMKSPLWWKKLVYILRGAARPKWFPLDASIPSLIIPAVTAEHVPDADVSLSTWWEMAYMIARLPPSKGKMFNLIQGYEIWAGHENEVHESYKLPVHHIVCAGHLQKLVLEKSGNAPRYIPIAIDTSRFAIRNSLINREMSILMMYSREAVKASNTGLEVLMRLKQQFPDLRVTLFGVGGRPSIPKWIKYIRKPDNLPGLYNTHAIFFSPSISEGWALPPAEAMACGCAVVCTSIGGHADYGFHGETAFLVEPQNMDDMCDKLATLLKNNGLRISIAQKGHDHITSNFNWNVSVDRLEEYFFEVTGYAV